MSRAAFGTWTSPVSPQMVAASALRLGQLSMDRGSLYWVEGRAHEAGRHVVVRREPDGTIRDATPRDTNARTRVQEYGGGAYAVRDGIVYYSEFADQRIYRVSGQAAPRPVTPAGPWRYADAVVDAGRQRLVCVRESHHDTGREADTTLVAIPLAGAPSAGQILASGYDFYASPSLNPDGSRLAWIAWRHPQMPWDGTELWVGEIAGGDDSGIVRPRRIAGGPTESIVQPRWAPNGDLYFVSDRTGWWNLYRWRPSAPDDLDHVWPRPAEFARPLWQLGSLTWDFAGPSRIVAAVGVRARMSLVTIELEAGARQDQAAPRHGPRTGSVLPTSIEPGDSLTASERHVFVLGGAPTQPDGIVSIDLETGQEERLRETSALRLDPRGVSEAETIEFPTTDGARAHAFFYAPTGDGLDGLDGERPPLLVVAHGGPTGAAGAHLNWEIQFWTSRGFAVVDVNYRGSAGYGRAYRQALAGQWGVADVADCVHAARSLVTRGEADPQRLIIRGRSAGGYTTLAALTRFPTVFAAGASYYGIGDLERLASDTHKFESRYLDGLVGPYPEARALYRDRSPIAHVDRLSCPLILFQGLEDQVVPESQATQMAEAVRAKGLPVALLTFPGEQHGFRKAETIVRCLQAELAFYGAVLGFRPADALPPLEIENIDRWRPGGLR